MQLHQTPGYKIINHWLAQNQRQPFAFQEQAWEQLINHKSGLINAPTGCGKTYSVFLGALIQFINQYPKDHQTKKNNGLQLLWITPLRALAKDIARAMQIRQWSLALRGVQDLTRFVGQRVVDADDFILCDGHVGPSLLKNCRV